jgi:hypothetical protein
MKVHVRSFAFLVALAVAGCASPQLYHPDPEPGVGHYGYSELPIDSTRYEVTFTGDFNTPTETVDQYALFRCAEITVSHGYDYFIVEHTRHWSMVHYHRTQLVTTYKMRMYHGERPDRNPNSYDAHEMISVVGPTIKRDS